MDRNPLYLCGGLQSSGSTLVSWCFLQRRDTNGILDARFDTLPTVTADPAHPNTWCKFTIACFRFSEVRGCLEDEGWSVRPLLVVRDPRAVFNSLIRKPWGRNGITADDPPLRLRLRRFREDFDQFTANGWPMLRFEDLVAEPEKTLKDSCCALGLAWDDAMISWPKPPQAIADPKFGNPTFVESRSQTLVQTVKPKLSAVGVRHIPCDDLTWIEEEFAAMNERMGYAGHIPPAADANVGGSRAVPTFENTRRCERLRRRHRVSRFVGEVRRKIVGLIGRSSAESRGTRPPSDPSPAAPL